MGLLDKINGAADSARNLYRKAEQGASDAVDSVKSETKRVYNDAERGVSEFVDDVKSEGQRVYNRAEQGASEFVDDVKKEGQSAYRKAERGVSDFVDGAKDKFETGKKYAEKIYDATKDEHPDGRTLKPDEVTELKKVYGSSIDYTKVRIVEGEDTLTKISDGRPFTGRNTIYVPKDRKLDQDLLTHEMLHVWQYQNGGSDYMPKALWAQQVGDGYDFEKGIDQGKAWAELNPEQQAEFIEQAVAAGAIDDPKHQFIYERKDKDGNVRARTDYSTYLNDALREIKAGRGAP